MRRQNVYAGVDGVVEDLYCKDNDKVVKDQLLAKLQNTDLEVAMTEVIGKRQAWQQELAEKQPVLARRPGHEADEKLNDR